MAGSASVARLSRSVLAARSSRLGLLGGAGGDLTQGRQRGHDRVRLVRVVDHAQYRPGRPDQLQPTGHPAAGGDAVRGEVRGHPHLNEAREREQRVGDVVPSRQGHRHRHRTDIAVHRGEALSKARTGDPFRSPGRPPGRPSAEKVICLRCRCAAGETQPPYRGIVVVEHLDPASSVKEACLRREVVVHTRVEVKVVLAEVGEATHVEPHPADPAVGEGVARYLHHRRGSPTLERGREQRVQVRRLGCGPDAVERLPGDAGLDRTDHAGDMPGGGQAGLDQVRG